MKYLIMTEGTCEKVLLDVLLEKIFSYIKQLIYYMKKYLKQVNLKNH